MRDMLFVSHANPEDNVFSRWLALRLANEGYGVWCDLTELLGGERFWNDIEEAIRQRTAKFVFVLSRSSNQKSSPRDELHLARAVARESQLADFIIPVWIDDLPAGEFNIELQNVNAIPFRFTWPAGFAQLLKKLDEDQVPRHPSFGPAAVTSWWRNHLSASASLRTAPERLVSNCYPVDQVLLRFHELMRSGIGVLEVPEHLPCPGTQYEHFLVSFAPADDFAGSLGAVMRISRTTEAPLIGEEEGLGPRRWSFAAERAVVTQLLKQAWVRMLKERGIPTYTFAGGSVAGLFTSDVVPNDRIRFQGYDGSLATRHVVGYSPRRRMHWHFGFQAKPTMWPVAGYILKPHVLFSDDGRTLWTDVDKMHRMRRRFCKHWWNDRWRDLIAATMTWLARDGDAIALPVGTDVTLTVRAFPIAVNAPVSFDDPSPEGPVAPDHGREPDIADDGENSAEDGFDDEE